VRKPFHIRPATIRDIDVVARHRASMFLDMGSITPDLINDIVDRTMTYLQEAVPRSEYIGWVTSPEGEPDRIVAGAGVQVRRVLPFPRLGPDDRADVADGRQAIVLNVYTEPSYRRRGLARALMYEVLAWARETDLESLVLHAAPDGRPLYEALGFTVTNEMRFAGDLASWSRPIGL
jgi:ribosomal protein S18 acetylase RimI-like enzyme